MESKNKSATATVNTPVPAPTAGWVAPKPTMNSYSFNARYLDMVNKKPPQYTTPTDTPGSTGPKETTPMAPNIDAKSSEPH